MILLGKCFRLFSCQIPREFKRLPWSFIRLISGETTSTIFFWRVSLRTGCQRGWKKIPRAKRARVIASAHFSNQRYDENIQIRRQWTVHCTRKPLLSKNYANLQQLSRSVNYLSQSCQLSSIQPIRSWYQELVSWNGGINGMSTEEPETLGSRLQAPLRTPSSPDRSRLIPFALDCTRLSPTGACSQATKFYNKKKFHCAVFEI